ncbi:MAG: hypothetical protein IJX28_07170 [Clostridia bacterium]|nr:hypothetical protein [Clostridia bacterium]
MQNGKNYKNFVNYFKKWEGAGMLGMCLMAVGFLFLWVGRSYLTYMISVFSIPVGIVIFLYGSIGRAGEADIKNVIERSAERIHFKELEEDSHLRKRTPKEYKEQLYGGYSFHAGVLVKRMKNGSPCSSEYDVAKLMELNDGYYVKTLHFSFISDEFSTATHDVPFAGIEKIEVERTQETISCGKKDFLTKSCHLVFTYDGGKRVLLPTNDDIYVDELAENLRRKHGI